MNHIELDGSCKTNETQPVTMKYLKSLSCLQREIEGINETPFCGRANKSVLVLQNTSEARVPTYRCWLREPFLYCVSWSLQSELSPTPHENIVISLSRCLATAQIWRPLFLGMCKQILCSSRGADGSGSSTYRSSDFPLFYDL